MAIASVKRNLKEVKQNTETSTDQINCLKVAATSLKEELEKEKAVATIRQIEGMASVAAASLEFKNQFRHSACPLAQAVAEEAKEAKSLAQTAREELRKAKEEAEQANVVASEKLALVAISAARCNHDKDSLNRTTLSLEEYFELSNQAHKAEEQANMRVAISLAQIKAVKESELIEKLE
ncbi:LOW QUALITY PROTEIN: hypothetical protein LguiB_028460 [Lonicera macranthoides]